MLLEELTLCDFGLFKGEHSFRLAPRTKYGTLRPIVLFGGLNGAGKTTILSAVRLALYGRQSIGHGISQKNYEQYLVDRLHRSKNSLVEPIGAHVSLQFKYYKLGEAVQFKVIRSWSISGKSVSETLMLYRNNSLVSDSSREQCQAFLNELVPIGVSDLFFFDGEKIGSLADDNGDEALRDAIRKLLGLDIIERLNSDLLVYGRRQQKAALPEDAGARVTELEAQLSQCRELAQQERMKAATFQGEIDTTTRELKRLEEELLTRGGAWGGTRADLIKKREDLLHHRSQVDTKIEALVSGLFPVTLVQSLTTELLAQLRREASLKKWRSSAVPVEERLGTLTGRLRKKFPSINARQLDGIIQSVFASLLQKPRHLDGVKLLHDLSDRDIDSLTKLVSTTNEVTNEASELKALADELDEQLASVSVQLERAPQEDMVKVHFEAVKAKSLALGDLRVRSDNHLEEARRYTWQAIEAVRKLRKLEIELEEQEKSSQALKLADATRTVLADFSTEVTKRKISKLEEEFVQTFSRLARKDDAVTGASIDPETFSVTLYDKQGRTLAKKELSAGEKQIYAVAMLDALARTSGRKLPLIIDTPLGRLDSMHRSNLVSNYFPYASHQVIVLSTDTEIDRTFYSDLSKHVSHAYHLVYENNEGSSSAKEGFFWRIESEGERYAS